MRSLVATERQQGEKGDRQSLQGVDLQRELLVTGCGGSGTTYVARLLTTNGVHVTHDFHLGPDGIVTNACDGESVWIYEPPLARGDVRATQVPASQFTHVVHLVRHPLLVIGSVYAKWQKYGSIWPHVREGLEELRHGQVNAEAAARYWLRWNQQIEQSSTFTCRFEQLLVEPQVLFEAIGRTCRHPLDPNQRILSSGASWYPEWQDLRDIDGRLAEDIAAAAKRYGYSQLST